MMWHSTGRSAVLCEHDVGTKLGLIIFAEVMRETQAHDPRDKVYGFLGMIFPKEQEIVIPDYTKECWDVLPLRPSQ